MARLVERSGSGGEGPRVPGAFLDVFFISSFPCSCLPHQEMGLYSPGCRMKEGLSHSSPLDQSQVWLSTCPTSQISCLCISSVSSPGVPLLAASPDVAQLTRGSWL